MKQDENDQNYKKESTPVVGNKPNGKSQFDRQSKHIRMKARSRTAAAISEIRRPRLILLTAFWVLFASARVLAQGTWVPLVNQPPTTIVDTVLLSDGSVMAHDILNGATHWYRLVPDVHGSYVTGTWSQLNSMHDARDYFVLQLLTNGTLFVAGGELYGGTYSAETYDPILNVWTFSSSVGSAYSDACSEILPNGSVLLAPVQPPAPGLTVIFTPASNTCAVGPPLYRAYNEDEASWVKLPDNSILTVDPYTTNSERYIPSLGQWIQDANVPVALWFGFQQIGPALLLPSNKVLFLGATTNTAFYTPSGGTNMGTWQAGPSIPDGQGGWDDSACMMPNGKALCMFSTVPTYGPPATFFEYDPNANTFTQVACPGGDANKVYPSTSRFLVLPDGSILFTDNNFYPGPVFAYVYKPDGLPLVAGQPTIISITNTSYRSYHLTGQLLNGLNEGANCAGGPRPGRSNYPLVRMTDESSNVYYARTFNWSSTGVMTGTNIVTTDFVVPESLSNGTYSLVVVANGIASAPVSFTFTSDPLNISSLNGYSCVGGVGGPFNPDEQAYFLNNVGPTALDYSLGTAASWLTVSLSGGSLASGGQVTLPLSISPTATNLPVGIYTGALWITNLTSGAAQSIPLGLEITTLIQNGGFEFGCFAGWSLSGDASASYVTTRTDAIINNPTYAHSGYFGAFLGMNNNYGYLSQNVTTVPQRSYLLSLFLYVPYGTGSSNDFAVSWNGITLFDQASMASTLGWTNLQFVVQATSPRTLLKFSFRNATTFFYLDDVTLTALPATLSIAAQPQSQVIPVGGDASLAVLVSGPSPVTYQWQKNGTNLQDGGDIFGSLTAALTITNAALADSGKYAVIVSSNSLSVTSLVATVTVSGIPTSCAVSAPSGLVSWWTANATANDVMGANNGTLGNGAIYTTGEVGEGFCFRGYNDYVSLGEQCGNFGTNAFTIEFWIETTSTPLECIISKRKICGSDSFWNVFVSGGTIRAQWEEDTAADHYMYLCGSRIINDGLFHHVAVTRRSTIASIYCDGVLDARESTVGITILSNSAPCQLGNSSPCLGTDGLEPFVGILDEIRIYARALSAGEIQAIYEAGTNGMCAPTPLMFSSPAVFKGTNGVVLNASLRSGESYRIEANTNLSSSNWMMLTNFTAGTSPVFHFTNLMATNFPQQFYRIVSP